MRDTHARPVCHRAEDLVAYLYGEGSEVDALDFGRHLHQCDACRREFTVFNQMHDSIQLWRNEALSASFNAADAAYRSVTDAREFVRHERKLSAMASLREFFNVSPLWLRGAAAFAALLLCVLGIITIARISRQPVMVVNAPEEKKYTREELDAAISRAEEQVREQLAKQNTETSSGVTRPGPRQSAPRLQVATNQLKVAQPRSLNRQEREQLAADLRLTAAVDEDELLLAFPDQENPNQ